MTNIKALEETWKQNLKCWGGNSFQVKRWFSYLVKQYTSKERKYHSLNHVIYMLNLAEKFKTKVHNWKAFYLAIWFHDAIQNKLIDNEKLSAQKCLEAIDELNLSDDAREAVQLILATESHGKRESSDAKLFIDLDLAILGSSKKEYRRYARQCRAEYKIPNFLYRRGRINVLEKFIERAHIYQSDLFQNKYEHQARINLSWEVAALKKGRHL